MALGTRTLIGQRTELEAALLAIEQARTGRGSVWLVSGEPGIGKSRLCEEVARIAAERELRVRQGRAWEVGGAPAYWPLVQVLRDLLHGPDAQPLWDRLAARLGARLRELAALLPEAELAPPEPLPSAPAHALPPEQARFRLLDTVTSLLCEASEHVPLVLLLEDLHAADASSLMLLDFLARQIHRARIFVVGTYREADAQRSHAGAALSKLPAERIALRRLEAHEAADFLAHAFGHPVDAALARAFFEATEGNPLFLGELARLHGTQLSSLGHATGSGLAIPSSVKAAIRERMQALPATLRALLGACSVLGRELRASTLAELLVELGSRQSAPELARASTELTHALDQCVQAEMLQELAPGRFRFAHVLLQQVAYSDLAEPMRVALHAAAAVALEREGSDPSFADRTHHLLAAGPSERRAAIETAKRAAHAAHAQHAHAEAAAFFAHALSALERGAYEERERCELLLELGQAELLSHALEPGRAHCRTARVIARKLGDAELFARAALAQGALFVIGQITPELVSALGEALELLGPEDSALRARVMARLSAALQPAEDPLPPIELAREAIAMARRLSEPETLLDVIRAGCSAMMDFAGARETRALCAEHIALATELDDASEVFRGQLRLSISAFEAGDLVAARAAVEACVRLSESIGEPHYQARAQALCSMRLAFDGELDEAGRASERARELGERVSDPNAAMVTALQRCARLELEGRAEELMGTLEALERLAPLHGFARRAWAVMSAGMLYRVGLREAARAWLERASLSSEALASVRGDRTLRDDVAIACILLDDREGSALHYADLLEHEPEWISAGVFALTWQGPVARTLGRLAFALGRFDEGHAHYARAIERTKLAGARALLARILLEAEQHALPDATSSRAPAALPVVSALTLTREGDYWAVSCDGRTFHLKHQKGVAILSRLMQEPGRELHVLDLLGGGGAVDGGDAGTVLDEKAKAAYAQRIEDLRERLDEAETNNDRGNAELAREELEQLEAELARAVGLGGRDRRASSAVERARVNVQRRLRDAIAKITEHDPSLGRHLEWAVRTGVYCSYLRE